MFEILPTNRWGELTEIFKREFEAELPNDKATILAEMDASGKVDKFVVLEFLSRIGQIWQTGTKSRAMFDFFNEQIPHGHSVIAIASSPRFGGLCEKYGMRKIDGVVYRKDF